MKCIAVFEKLFLLTVWGQLAIGIGSMALLCHHQLYLEDVVKTMLLLSSPWLLAHLQI